MSTNCFPRFALVGLVVLTHCGGEGSTSNERTAIAEQVVQPESLTCDRPVFDTCLNAGQTQLSACGAQDWTCKCNADKAMQLCYLQCLDDEQQALSQVPATIQTCALAAAQTASSL